MLCTATAVSVAVHGVAVGLILHKAPVAPSGRSSDSRTRAAVIVVLHHGSTQKATVPAAAIQPAAPRPLPRPASPVKRVRALVPSTATHVAPPKEEAVPVAAVPVAPVAVTPPPAANRFAGLFAPVGGPSMGRGRWGGGMVPPAAPDPGQQRAQSALAWQMALHARLSLLAENLRGAESGLACDIVVDTDQQIGEVHCTPETDQAIPWTYLQGLLAAGRVADSAPRFCFRLADRQLFAGHCPTTAP